jgi:MFS family permease
MRSQPGDPAHTLEAPLVAMRRSREPRARTGLLLSWLVFGVAVSFNAYDAYLRVTPSVSSEALRVDLQAGATQLGNMMTWYFAPYVLLQVPVGLLIDRLGARRLLAAAVATSAIGSLLFATSASVAGAYAARLLMGIGGAFPGVGPIYLASRWFPASYLGLLAGLTGSSTVVGAVGGQAVLGELLDVITWRTASWIAAGVGLVIAVLLLLVVRDRPPAGHPLLPTLPAAGSAQGASSPWRHLRRVVTLPQNWLNAVWGSLTLMPMLAFAALWATPFLSVLYQVPAKTAATAVSMAFLGLAFGGPVAGIVSERLASRRVPMMLFALVALVDSVVIVYLPVPFAAMYPPLFVLGFCLGSQGSLVFAVALELNAVEASGVAIGFTQGMSNLGGAVFPPVIGALLAYSAGGGAGDPAYGVADYRVALAVLPVGLAVAVLAAFSMTESFRRTDAQG